ncbi:endothelin-converting enzyme 2-like isoform X2 [Amblyomma americanum]
MFVFAQNSESTEVDGAADSVAERRVLSKRKTVVAVLSTGVAVGAILSSLLGALLVGKRQGPVALMQSDLRSWTMAALYATAVPEKNQSAWEKAAGMLQACDSIGQTGGTEVPELQKWLASLKLDLRNMEEDDAFDPVDALVELSIVHGQPAVLALQPDRLLILRNSRAMTLSVNMDDCRWYQFLLRRYGRPESTGTQLYEEHLRDYGIAAGLRERLSQEIATHERKVIEVVESYNNEEPALEDMAHRSPGLPTIEEATNDHWAEAVSRHTGGAYGPQSRLLVRPPAGRLQHQALVNTWGARILLAWSLLRRLLPAALGQPPRYTPFQGVSEACFQRVTEAMQTAIMGRYVERVLRVAAMTTTTAMLDGLRAAYSRAFTSAAWLKVDDAAGVASRKLNRTRFLVGLPGGVSTTAQLDALHADKEDSGARFLPAWLRAMKLEARRLVFDHSEPAFDFGLTNVLYLSAPNALVVPAGLLRPPLLCASGPASLNYGGLGQMVASEMMRGYVVKGMQLNDDGEKRPWRTTAQRVHLTSSAVCVSNTRLNVTDKEAPTSRAVAATDPDFDLLAELSGLQIALAAFRALPSETRLLSPPSLSPEQAFFVSHCAKWCSPPTRPESTDASVGKMRCLVPLANMQAFSQAFNCSATSQMNRPRKCRLW